MHLNLRQVHGIIKSMRNTVIIFCKTVMFLKKLISGLLNMLKNDLRLGIKNKVFRLKIESIYKFKKITKRVQILRIL